MRSILICLLFIGSAAATPRHLTLINDSPDRVNAVHSAAPGSDAWLAAPLAEGGLPGGGNAETLRVDPGAGCLSDLRIDFASGRRLIIRDLNICRYHSLRAGLAWRIGHARQRALAALPATKDESGSHP